MDIIKAFQKNEIGINITIQGSIEEPLFRANDIATVLEMGNIRTSIQDFDSTEKAVRSMDTLGGTQEVTFLTEKGLYKVLFKSRKPIAKKFTDWVCEVIKEVRINGVYDLKKQLETKDKEIGDINNNHELNLIRNFDEKPVIYVAYVEKDVLKFGFTDNIKQRLKDHKKTYGPDFTLEYVYESIYNRVIEKYIKKHKIIKTHIINKEYNSKNITELIQLSDKLKIKDIDMFINEIKDDIESYENDKDKNEDIEKLKKELEISELKAQIAELKNVQGPITKPKQGLYSGYEKNYTDFIKELVSKFEGILYSISKRDLYTKYEEYTEKYSSHDNLYSYVAFNRKMIECPCVKDCRVKLDKDHPNYSDNKDSRVHGFVIDISSIKLWLSHKEYDSEIIVDFTKEGNHKKYYLSFLVEFIKHGGKSKRSSQKPKDAKNPFFCYCKDVREEISKEFPGYNSAQITTEIGKRWNEMKENEPGKLEYYKNKHLEDKKRYSEELEKMSLLPEKTIISVSNDELYKTYVRFILNRNYSDMYSDVSFSRILKECPYIIDSKTTRKINGKNTSITLKNLCTEEIEKWVQKLTT